MALEEAVGLQFIFVSAEPIILLGRFVHLAVFTS